MKRLLTVQDLSCLGKCSLTVALPILSAMGVETAVLPTAVLSTHTAFPSPYARDMTPDILPVADHWQQIGAEFDGMYIGYLSSGRQVASVLELVKRFPVDMLLVDPVMGDNGKLYDRIDADHVQQLKALCAAADMIVPNLTEACALTDTPYRGSGDEAWLKDLLIKLTALGCGAALITGVPMADDTIGVAGYSRTSDRFFLCRQKRLPESYHGTGDAFAAVCAGAVCKGAELQTAAQLAADFTARCIRQTMEENRDKRYGLCFEKALPELWSLQ